MADVGILIGSKNDLEHIEPLKKLFDEFGISYTIEVISAHRNPEGVRQWAIKAEEQGIKVIVAAAGAAAHLPGTLAAWSNLPVIGIPLPTSPLNGLDSLLSIVQMPAGVPVACMAIGSAGVSNAAYFVARVLGLWDRSIRERHDKKRKDLAAQGISS